MIGIECIERKSNKWQSRTNDSLKSLVNILAEVICFALGIELFVNFDEFLLVKFAIGTITKKSLISKTKEFYSTMHIIVTHRMPLSDFYRLNKKEANSIRMKTSSIINELPCSVYFVFARSKAISRINRSRKGNQSATVTYVLVLIQLN